MTLQEKRKLLKAYILKDRLLMPEKMKAFKERCRYKFAWGGRGGGKSHSICKILLDRANREKIKVLCAREIQNSIADSVYSDLKEIIEELYPNEYEVTKNEITNKNSGSLFRFVGLFRQDTKQSIKSYANFDICWIEEAQAISEGSLKILTPTIRKTNSEIWFSFNRLLPDDAIWLFKDRINERRKVEINININENPYASQVLVDDYEEDKALYNEGRNDDFLHVWMGEPYSYSQKTIFTVDEIYQACQRESDYEGAEEVGCDVARFGKDLTVFFKRKGLGIIDFKFYPKTAINEVCDYLVDFVSNNTKTLIKVDDTGVGGGVTDFMKSKGFNVAGVNNGSKAFENDKYNNRISELWFYLKSIIGVVSLPDIPELKQQLLTREWKIDNKGRRCIESKDDYKKRGFKSPDWADALLLCFAKDEEDFNPFMDGLI